MITVVAILVTAVILMVSKNKEAKACLVTGDVQKNISVEEVQNKDYTKFEVDNHKLKGIPLVKLIKHSIPQSKKYSILLMGYDGLFAKLNGDELKDCYVVNRQGSWDIIAINHPINANIKDLEEIIVTDETGSLEIGVNIISQTKNLFHTTPGNMILEEMIIYPYLDGQTQVNDKNGISLYKQKKVIPLSKVIHEEVKSILVMSHKGEMKYFTELGYLEVNKNTINYMEPKNRTTIQDIAGIIINPPNQSVLDTYEDSLYYVNKDEKVMLVYIDGFGYHQYEYAKKNELIPHLTNFGSGTLVNTVYKSVTNAGFCAMITGQPPIVNGIKDRSVRIPKIPTIFDVIHKNKNHVLIESNGGILKLNTKTIYSIDENNDKSTDKEVYENTIKQLQEKQDFVMVHFHGVDDAGHNYGDLNDQTMKVLTEVDGYIGSLLEVWDGKVIIVSDHGMHSVEDHGDHGSFRYEDMFVPYLINE